MNLDYVREQINDKDIDVPFARRALVKQAALELKPITDRRPVSGLLYGAWLTLASEPSPERVQQAVNDLCVVLNDALMADVVLPGSYQSQFLVPGPEPVLESQAKQYDVAAAVLRALDCLSWVLAYDQLLTRSA